MGLFLCSQFTPEFYRVATTQGKHRDFNSNKENFQVLKTKGCTMIIVGYINTFGFEEHFEFLEQSNNGMKF